MPDQSELPFPGLDLLLVEGHGDSDTATGNKAAVAINRSQAVLHALLTGQTTGWLNDPLLLAKGIDDLANANATGNSLLFLTPLSSRLVQECAALVSEDSPDWCRALLEGADSEVRKLADRAPRLFAMTSYGRFSLRYGNGGIADPRDRRVEFRLRGATIPTAIHDLVKRESQHSLYRLYTTDAVSALYECDSERIDMGPDAANLFSCVGHLVKMLQPPLPQED